MVNQFILLLQNVVEAFNSLTPTAADTLIAASIISVSGKIVSEIIRFVFSEYNRIMREKRFDKLHEIGEERAKKPFSDKELLSFFGLTENRGGTI